MRGFSDIVWLTLALVAGFGVLQVLRAMAINVRNRVMIHDLRVNVSRLQVQQLHAQMLRLGMVPRDGGVEILDDEGDDAPVSGPPVAQGDTTLVTEPTDAGDAEASGPMRQAA